MPARRVIIRRIVWAAGALLAVTLGMAWFGRSGTAYPPLPQPNGYDALVVAAARMTRPPDDYRTADIEKLATAVELNRQPVELIRQALKLRSAVPVVMAEDWFSTHTGELMNLKGAVQALDAEAVMALRTGDTNTALNIAMEMLLLSDAIQRGGVVMDSFVGSAGEAIALSRMTNLLAGLDQANCLKATEALSEHERRRDSLPAILSREAEWSRRTFGPFARIRQMIEARSLNPDKLVLGFVPNAEKVYHSRTMEARKVLLRFAARAYFLETGKKPTQASELVPRILPEHPTDPATGDPLPLP